MRHLLAIAARLGYGVHFAHIDDDPRLLGYTAPDEGIIVLRLGMTRAQTLSVLAHEIGHAYHGHQCDSAANERQADTIAATILIHPPTYAELERINPDPHYLADELGVTVDIITAYREHCLVKLQGVSYTRSKMGAGQWHFRSAHA